MPLPAAAIDLHCHSRASDGQLSPTELLDLAAAQGVQRLALTDHDTVAGLAEAGAAHARMASVASSVFPTPIRRSVSNCRHRVLPGKE